MADFPDVTFSALLCECSEGKLDLANCTWQSVIFLQWYSGAKIKTQF